MNKLEATHRWQRYFKHGAVTKVKCAYCGKNPYEALLGFTVWALDRMYGE